MEPSNIQIISLIVSLCTALFVMLIGIIVGRIYKSIDVCVVDTKECNKSVGTLSANTARLDQQVSQLANQMSGLHNTTQDMSHRITRLETTQELNLKLKLEAFHSKS